MADEATIRKLDALVKEKEKEYIENNRIKQKNDNEIRDIKDAIEEERRKSMVDERKLSELAKMLDQKIKLANEMNGQVAVYAKKEAEDEEAINFLKEEIEKERRKSSADQGLIRKMEALVHEKERVIEDNKRRFTSLET
jgi:hypothetical protein